MLVDVGLVDVNTNAALPIDNRQLTFRLATEGPVTDLSIRKNLTDFTVTVPGELFIADKVYEGVILVDNQWQTTIWVKFAREGRGCPNPASIVTLDRSSRSATSVQGASKWSIRLKI
jgi:hypothetical protein